LFLLPWEKRRHYIKKKHRKFEKKRRKVLFLGTFFPHSKKKEKGV